MDAPFLQKEKDLEKNQIIYNKEDPELILAQKKEKDLIPNPEQQKKDFQEKKLDETLRKSTGPKMSKKLRDKVYNPEIFQLKKKTTAEKANSAYDETKKENLKEDSIAANEISRGRIETDRKKASHEGDESAQMHYEQKQIEAAAEIKKNRMLALTTDPEEQIYIAECIQLDKCMKMLEAIKRTVVNNTELRKKAIAQAKKLMDNSQIRLKKQIARMDEAKKAKEGKQKSKDRTAKKTTGTQGDQPEKQTKTKKSRTDNAAKKKEIKKPDVITYEHWNGRKLVPYFFVKRKPANLAEAIDLRSQVTRNFDVLSPNCPEVPKTLYTYYEGFVDEFSKTEEIQYPPEYLQKIDVSNLNLETVVMLRNRITNRGLLYKDLKGAAKEAYDYYDEIVKRLIRTDGSMKERVEQHQKRNVPEYHVMLQTNLGTEYEKQVSGSNDCWSCAGAAILNHYLRNKQPYKKVTQADLRNYKPVLKTQESMGVDDETYEKQKNDIEEFTIHNTKKARIGSPMGNPFMIADFYLEKLEQAGEKNTAVRKMVFQPGRASKQKKGVQDNKGNSLGKDTNALDNLRVKFMDVVKDALDHDSALTLLYGVHYLTIVGIEKDELIVHNSSGNPAVTERRKISDVLCDSESQKSVELIWLQKIEDPKNVTDQFKNVAYDPNTKQFSEKVRNYSENIAQNKGVGAWKNLDEKDDDIADLVMDGIYLPKQFSVNA